MSNLVTLVATQFTSLNVYEDTSYGFRIYDNYGSTYCNLLSYDEAHCDDEELLRYAVKFTNNEIDAMLDHAKDFGIMINDTFYESNELIRMLNNG